LSQLGLSLPASSPLAHGSTGEWIVDVTITLGIAAVGVVVWLRGRGERDEDGPDGGWREDE
jgi:hypothetical protein